MINKPNYNKIFIKIKNIKLLTWKHGGVSHEDLMKLY